MSMIRYGADLNVLVVTKGHPFERDPFFAMFEAQSDMAYTAVEQPAAQMFFSTENAKPYDAFVLYDMPGIEFTPSGPRFHDPPAEYVSRFLDLLESGHGFVFLHHSIAGWPTWPEYAEIIGGRFLYAPDEIHGRPFPASGYRHEVKHRVHPATKDHPVLAGLDEGFEIEDELYLCPIFEAGLNPLLKSDYEFVESNFYSSQLAVAGKMFSREGWSHPSGSNWIAWTHRYRNSRVVYIACGDSAKAYANPSLIKLIGNAVRYVAGESKK